MTRNTLALSVLAATFLLLSPARAQDTPPRQDLMSFASGVLPVSVSTGDADLRTDMTHAIAMIDGNSVKFSATPKPGTAEDVVEIVYAMPAPTRFDRFAIPQVLETPSPSQTFFANVEVLGSDQSAEGPFVPLAQGELTVHPDKTSVTELTLAADQPEALWVKLRLSGGLDIQNDKTFFEFSEIIGHGARQAAAMSEGFSGVWKGRGVNIELAQDGASVTGCYNETSELTGTVDGTVLRALGFDYAGVPSQFILIATEDGALRGLRSTNGAPFKPYDGEASDDAPVCLPPPPAGLGCGAVVHGIGFDFDSDVIRPESQPVLDAIHQGLSAEANATFQIIGHSSSEGEADYNRDLSQRRAQSVVAALVASGIDASRISAAGKGEDEPIAGNDDEAGRSLNRRVEIRCAG